MAHSLIPALKRCYCAPPDWAVKVIWGGLTGLIFVTLLIPVEIAVFWQGQGSLSCLFALMIPGLGYYVVERLGGEIASLIILPASSLLAAGIVADVMRPDGIQWARTLTAAALGAFLPWLIYWMLLTLYLAGVFALGAVFQMITWAGRAWRGERLFDA